MKITMITAVLAVLMISGSAMASVFFYDEFERTSLGSDWSTDGTASIESGALKVGADAVYYNGQTFGGVSQPGYQYYVHFDLIAPGRSDYLNTAISLLPDDVGTSGVNERQCLMFQHMDVAAPSNNKMNFFSYDWDTGVFVNDAREDAGIPDMIPGMHVKIHVVQTSASAHEAHYYAYTDNTMTTLIGSSLYLGNGWSGQDPYWIPGYVGWWGNTYGAGSGIDAKLDNLCISDDDSVTPEPATLGLLVIGGLTALRRRRR